MKMSGACLNVRINYPPGFRRVKISMLSIIKLLVIPLLFLLSGCATTIAMVDLAGATAVKAVKTTAKAVDAITPDILE